LFAATIAVASLKGQEAEFLDAFDSDITEWTIATYIGEYEPSQSISKSVMHGDTVINGLKWKKTNISIGRGKVFIRKDDYSRKYYFLSPLDDVHPGEFLDEIMFLDFSIYSSDSIVLDDGCKHLCYYKYDRSEILRIEGLGSQYFPPLYEYQSQPTCSCYSNLVCCHVNGKLLYKNPIYSDCKGTRVGNEPVAAVTSDTKAILTDGVLKIVSFGDKAFDVEVFNVQGQRVESRKSIEHDTTIPFAKHSKGIYFVTVVSGTETTTHKVLNY